MARPECQAIARRHLVTAIMTEDLKEPHTNVH